MKLMQSTSHFVQVIIGTSLYFQAMKVNYWNRKYLNSNKSTKIDTCDDVALYHKSTSVVDIQNSKREDHNSPTWRYHCNWCGEVSFAFAR